ncbi:AraC family transcriptional regulator [Paenibacillus sp. 1001270B_150601_E10]|uniref:AraC family transcriptional regulator n=1 Tax=Paenibacillus sp. 1001270B_150601_E10 TaxID=2787079 RepID=UPI0018A07CA1|nr:AraC family transcriptional regulator [Paenibacillus sp. 1001270B_150601_E10]
MECYERMEAVISYLEANLTGECQGVELARIAGCPIGIFQRIFSFMLGMTMSDYMRRRRLTLAVEELQLRNEKVIDIALKYGYDSHASFTRAFKEQHGISPSQAREGLQAQGCLSRISFQHSDELGNEQTYRMEKGRRIMSKLTKIEFANYGPYKIVGKEIRTAISPNIQTFWGQCFEEGMYDKLLAMKEHIPTDILDDYVGYFREYDNADETFKYVVGMFMNADAPVPEGCVGYDIPETLIAKAWIQGEEVEIYNNAYFLITEALKQNGYEADWEQFYWCEVYTDARFGIPKSIGEKCLTLDYYMPCKRAAYPVAGS